MRSGYCDEVVSEREREKFISNPIQSIYLYQAKPIGIIKKKKITAR